MQTLNFKRFFAKNFLCFGPEGIEINLKTMGNIILVLGGNFDDMQADKPGSNGTGKSSLIEILVYGLFGKPLKRKLTQKDVIHTKVGKDCKIIVEWDNYRVERCHKPNSLRLWESADGVWNDETEISAGAGIPETQKKIEERIGLNYRTFINLLYFDDRNSNGFLECDGPTKREIVENLLSLDKYREFSKSAKELMKEEEKKIKILTMEYSRLDLLWDETKKRTIKLHQQKAQWQQNKKQEVEQILAAAKQKRVEMSQLDIDSELASWNRIQNQIQLLTESIPPIENKQAQVEAAIPSIETPLATAEETYQGFLSQKRILAEELQKKQIEIRGITTQKNDIASLKPGVICNTCKSVVDPGHYANLHSDIDRKLASVNTEIGVIQGNLEAVNKSIETAQAEVQKSRNTLSKYETFRQELARDIRNKQQEIQSLMRTPQPEGAKKLQVIEEQITHLKQQAAKAMKELEGASPYDENIADSLKEETEKEGNCRAKKDEIAEAEKLLPYYKYWINAFGDEGIRKFVIEGIVPTLNSRISHWLECLICGNISLSFDESFNETIRRVPFQDDEFVYYAMSGGEQRRINLAVTLAFAYIMMLNSKRNPNLIFLDEVAINIDDNGIECVYQMILQLAQDKKVFVTTHDPMLRSLLQNHEVLKLERRNGFTKLV